MDRARTRGQAVALRAIAGMIRGPAPHAVLLVGPDGVGKTTLALDLAAGLLCTAEPAQRPCRECRACRLVDGGGQPTSIGSVPSARTSGRHRRTRCQVPGRARSIGELALMPAEGGTSGRHHRGRRAHERGWPVGPAQDPRGASGGRDHHPVRRGEATYLPTVRRGFRVRLGLVGPRDIEAIIADHGLADPPTAARLGRLAGGRPVRARLRRARPRPCSSGPS